MDDSIGSPDGDMFDGIGLDEFDNLEAGTEGAGEAPTFKVKIDGQEVEVGLDELLQGYSRTSDYTKKTQALAAERAQLAQAKQLWEQLQADPDSAVRTIRDVYGLDNQDEFLDPTEKRVRELEQKMAAQSRAAQEQANAAKIAQDIASLKAQFGEFDEAALIQHAIDNRIPNLEAAYAHMQLPVLQGKAKLVDEVKARKAAREAAAIEAKRDASVISDGGAVTPGVISKPQGRMGIAGAFRAAVASSSQS